MRVAKIVRHFFRDRVAEAEADVELDQWLADLSKAKFAPPVDWSDPASVHAALDYIEADPAWWQQHALRMGARAALLQSHLNDAHRDIRLLRGCDE